MAAWAESPYRAIGIYIGGENSACSQPNLTASWVSAQTAAGWHLIPTYVGLQAPTSACSSCAKLSASRATAQGEGGGRRGRRGGRGGDGPGQPDLLRHGGLLADRQRHRRRRSPSSRPGPKSCTRSATSPASTAAAPPGSPTSPTRSAPATSCPTTSGSPTGTARQNTIDPVPPGSGWTHHQRIHQYRGGHNETYGGATINIDNNYVDGGDGRRRHASATTNDDPVGSLDLAGSPRAGPGAGQGLGLRPERARPNRWRSASSSAAGEGAPGRRNLRTRPVANQARADVAAKFPASGPNHGFDLIFPTSSRGRSRSASTRSTSARRQTACSAARRRRSRSRSPSPA